MERILEVLKRLWKSRTVRTFAVLFIVSGIEGVRDMIPAGLLPWVTLALASLGSYYRLNAKGVK